MKYPIFAGDRGASIRGRWMTMVVVGMVIAVASLPVAFAKKPARHAKHDRQDRDACADAYTQGKERASSGRLREARDLFARCAKSSCSAFLHRECGSLYSRTDADIPSVIPVVSDASGAPRALVEVKVDGALLTSRLDGHSLQVDPGKHEFSFSTDDGVFATQKVMVLQGQHNVPIKAVIPGRQRRAAAVPAESAAAPTLAASEKFRDAAYETAAVTKSAAPAAETGPAPEQASPPASPVVQENGDNANDGADKDGDGMLTTAASTPSRRMPALGYVFGGVGLAGVGGYFLLNSWGRRDNDKLSACAAAGNLCQPADVDHVRNLYLAANISGAVGLAALATSVWLYVRSSSGGQETPSATTAMLKRRSSGPSVRMVDVQAGQSGALATVGGSF